ncbi:MAG: putative glycoside hydrolase, partial [Labilithrix sp.]|nr:putative glycoside hydrolase [Labilithrix sp.]
MRKRLSLNEVARATFLAALVLSLAVGACAVEDAADPAASPPAPRRDEPPVPATPSPGVEPPVDTSVVVGHERELRGAWISTVYNGTWPSRTGLAAAAAKAELTTIFDALASARMNTVFFQVRAESDAVYASTIEPWSRFLTGKQGEDPGWDPLAFAVEEGHKRGLEVHAWLNPYRGLVSTQIEVAASHVTKMLPTATRAYGNLLWMDPGVPEVRAHILDVVRDILMRYDVDGIHFDDYFYPYPVTGQTFDDAAPFAVYTGGGGTLAKDDWRRSNVDALVRETSELVLQTRASVRFGVSPFGIYRPGIPAGITGLDAWATLYCDPVRWMDEGWVDYLAPQLY